ncbi:MAG: alkyl sulfatase dimerization domain-containing protein [Pontixanthobacter sp.]
MKHRTTLGLMLGSAIILMGNAPPEPGEASEHTAAYNARVAAALPLDDPRDFADARRGLLAQLDSDILNADGSVAWDVDEFAFLERSPPQSVNPSLWRQSRLAAMHGLFEVVPGIYQIRGYDLAVMTLIVGESGWIVVDPLLTAATARAGLDLANRTLGERPVSAVIYTHSHGDHFGGVRGVLSVEDYAKGDTPVIAPHGFTAEVVGENVLAGTAMTRRAQYQFATAVPSSAFGPVGVGLGPKLAQGSVGLLPPTRELTQDGGTLTIDGVAFEFLDAGGTEAPAEFVFYLPRFRALHTAEVATRTFHNVLTPRGALVRDTLEWSRAIDTILMRFGPKSDVVLASHHWPGWGRQVVRERLRNQRDIYRYVHDQTLRMANQGLTMDEIAERIDEPAFAADDFGARGYYGTFEHNAKAVYQRYFGWWNAVPADYDPLPKVEEAGRWIDAIGGPEKALRLGREAHDAGDYRWSARLLQSLVFAYPGHRDAKPWLAASYEQLAFQSEAGTWRNLYLAAAHDLRTPIAAPATALLSQEVVASIPTLDLFDALASRFDPAKMQGDAKGGDAVLQFTFPDTNETIHVDLRRSVMFPRRGTAEGADAGLTIARVQFNRLLARKITLPELVQSGEAAVAGNPALIAAMFAALDEPDPGFAIVTP